MNKTYYVPSIFFLMVLFFSCSQPATESRPEEQQPISDAHSLLRSFLPGLWSLDSGNILTNEGYFISNDGTISFVASEMSGNWETPSTDSLIIKYSDYEGNKEIHYQIDSISESQMILSSNNEKMIFRKVPFGENQQETVLNGFGGSLRPGEEKQYDVNLPGGKKVALRLNSKGTANKLSLSEGSSILATDVSGWKGILVRSGKYHITLRNTLSKGDATDFDLKVISY